MANQSNLKPQAHQLTVDEARKGGKKSGAVRGFKAALKRHITENPNDVMEIIDNLFEAAKGGDIKALQIIIELSGESIKDKELAIHKQEVKVKEKHYESTDY